MKQLVCAAFVCYLFFLFTSNAFAGDIRVADPLGLVRAMKKNVSNVTVIVRVREGAPAPSTLELRNVDGLARAVKAVKGEGGVYRFEPVAPGSWQIGDLPKGVKVSKVKIDPSQ